MAVFDEEFGIAKGISHQTVSDWVKTFGLAMYKEAREYIKTSKMKYALIIDESITIGSQKLLLILAVPSEHSGHALTHDDVKVVGMFVAKSWNAADIEKKLQEIISEISYRPEYMLSDNGHNLVKSACGLEIPHHRDVSHTFGNILKDAYGEDAEFKEITTEMGKARLQFHLTDKAYLLPPNQRAISRFLNCFDWVEWGNRILDNYDKLTPEERLAFAFILKHEKLLRNLRHIMDCYKYVMKRIKNEGLSVKLFKELRYYVVREHLDVKEVKRMTVMLDVLKYMEQEVSMLKPGERAHNLSSDIIESTFGVYKDRKSPNNLYGVTPFVLFIPAHAKVIGWHDTTTIDIKRIFSENHLKDVKEWRDKNLLTNWVVKRAQTLKKVG